MIVYVCVYVGDFWCEDRCALKCVWVCICGVYLFGSAAYAGSDSYALRRFTFSVQICHQRLLRCSTTQDLLQCMPFSLVDLGGDRFCRCAPVLRRVSRHGVVVLACAQVWLRLSWLSFAIVLCFVISLLALVFD